MDIMNAPSRGGGGRISPVPRQRARIDGLRTSGRRLDDFHRPEGYHAVQPLNKQGHAVGGKPPIPLIKGKGASAQHHARQQASILNMTLPGGALDEKQTKKKKQKDKGKHSTWRTTRKWVIRSALAVFALVLLTGGFLAAKGYFKIHKVFKGGGTAAALQAEVKPELLKGEGDGRINVLLLGTGGGNHDGPDLTDTILVASIDPVNKNASLVSLPRDLWVAPNGTSYGKINAVYANAKYKALAQNPQDKEGAERAGIAAIQTTATQVLGVPINYYIMVDFLAFKQAVDAVGGVDMVVPENLAVTERLWDETTGKNYYLNVPAGPQHFDGQRALFFTRSRHTSLRGDFDRTERQRLFIAALSQKILSAGTYTNPVKLSQLMSAFGDHVATDFSVKDALRMMTISKGISTDKLISVGLADPPNAVVRTGMIGASSVVMPIAGIGDYSAIQAYVRNKLKDPYLSQENAGILVLNGTDTMGLAGIKSDQLKTYGYNVLAVGDAPTSAYPKTQIIDLTNGKKPFTKNYLEKRFKVKATTKLPEATIQTQGADFVIILGQNETANSQN
jgi:polyisoprenyl-teichoic acid--peptidoglycan teichoic acid transferase